MTNLFTEYIKCSEELAQAKKELQKIKEQLEEAHEQNLLLTQENHQLKKIFFDFEKSTDAGQLKDDRMNTTVHKNLINDAVKESGNATTQTTAGNRKSDVDLKMEVDEHLDFNAVSWVKDKIKIIDGSVVLIDNGKVVNLTDFMDIMENRPWILFPNAYEVQCHNYQCRNTISLIFFGQDKCSVYCPKCQSPTVLENVAYGHKWVVFRRCGHFQQISLDDTDLQFCEFCDTEGRYMVITDRFVRLPKEKNMGK